MNGAFRILWLLMVAACAGAPRISTERFTREAAKKWLGNYCSRGPRGLMGQLVIRSDTPDFKGQFPASIRVGPEEGLLLEVTHILGGTLVRLRSDFRSFELEFPSKPAQNRKGLTRYLGLEVPVLSQLLFGDLPCPEGGKRESIRVVENRVEIEDGDWIWTFFRGEGDAQVPVKVVLAPRGPEAATRRVELEIIAWDSQNGFAEKVRLQGPEGTLKWIWKNRQSGVQ
jgi:hypothetical protein